jgi:hypothetical protein
MELPGREAQVPPAIQACAGQRIPSPYSCAGPGDGHAELQQGIYGRAKTTQVEHTSPRAFPEQRTAECAFQQHC